MVAAGQGNGPRPRHQRGQVFRVARKSVESACHDKGRQAQCCKCALLHESSGRARKGSQRQSILSLLICELSKTFRQRRGNRVHVRRLHRIGHRITAGRRFEPLSAHSTQNQSIDSFGSSQCRCRGELRTHGISHQRGRMQTKHVHHTHDVRDKCVLCVICRIVGLGAFSVTAQIDGDCPHAPPLERAKPSEAAPILGTVGSKTVKQQDRPRVRARAYIVIRDGNAVGFKDGHDLMSDLECDRILPPAPQAEDIGGTTVSTIR